jgi:heat shock protein HslJ
MKLFALPAALLLAACAATAAPPPATPSAAPYFALGQEPGWTLEIAPDALRYSGDYGAVTIREANPGARARGSERRYAGQRLAVTITPGPCSDSMSGRRYTETVMVMADGKQVAGCGGALLPPENLVGTLWRFTHIGGAAVADEGRTELRFADGRLGGTAGCNRFSGSYTLNGATLTPGAIASTRMACMGPEGEQERMLFALLSGPVTIGYGADGAMTLTGADGMTARLVQRP